MFEIFVVLVASVMLVLVKGQVHCGRIIVSGSWEFCPFCGKSLAAESKHSKARKAALAKAKQVLLESSVERAALAEVRIAGKTHFLAPAKNDLQMTTQLPSRCLHVASRGKPKGKQCTALRHQDGHHRYGKKK